MSFLFFLTDGHRQNTNVKNDTRIFKKISDRSYRFRCRVSLFVCKKSSVLQYTILDLFRYWKSSWLKAITISTFNFRGNNRSFIYSIVVKIIALRRSSQCNFVFWKWIWTSIVGNRKIEFSFMFLVLTKRKKSQPAKRYIIIFIYSPPYKPATNIQFIVTGWEKIKFISFNQNRWNCLFLSENNFNLKLMESLRQHYNYTMKLFFVGSHLTSSTLQRRGSKVDSRTIKLKFNSWMHSTRSI